MSPLKLTCLVLNLTKQTTLVSRARMADTFFSRMKGLLNTPSLGLEDGLIITRCNSIHMFFMRYPIDVVFIDRRKYVVGLVQNIKPYRASPIFWKAHAAIEVSPGRIASSRTSLGDQIHIEQSGP